MSKPENGPQLPVIRWPVPKNNRGGEFSNLEEMLAHLEGEAAGHWLIGRNGMWHGGIHISDTTTPWCALSGQAMNEAVDFPVPFKGEQAVRCMADGEVVAYRINRDYLSVPWYWGDLRYSGSFVLVRHRVQPGKTAESGLTFYTLYMHLAPWLAYSEQDSTAFKVADGQHLNAYVDASRQWVAAELPSGTRVTWNKAVSADFMTGNNGRQYAHVTLAEPVASSMSLKAGDRVWTVCDKGNLVPARDSTTRPAWWSPFLPPSRETVLFDTVVCPTPYPIKAGDPVGHLGWFQVPTEDGHEKRYQVHIECLTTDDLPRFLNNPEGTGRDTPAFARCPKGIPVYLKVTGGEIQKGLITTTSETVMALSGQAMTDSEGKRYWPGGSSSGLLAESDVQLLSRFDLGGRGFEAIEDSPASFDHLDGKTQPKGLVKTIFERFFSVADNDGQPYSKGVAFNYRQLLNQIDDAKSPRYNPEQYRRAVQNPAMRDHLHRLCVKHPCEWYYSSESPVWKAFFTSQKKKKEEPEWYAYSEKFLIDLRWMHRVPGMVENQWHMHPLVFLDAIHVCKSKSNRPKSVQDFIDMALPSAKATSDKWRVPVSVLLAQSALESGWGQKVKNNAYFGIKGKSSSGNSASFGTTEYENGRYVSKVQTFRAYNGYSESADDYGRFLAENRRYRPAFEYVTQPEKFVHQVATAGYATDPTYESKLIKIMRSYDFYEYD
ncbi:glycoside hydrolase family 73 protein [Siccibacter colletis]|uniref:glycoside hydrolase family 73 protein n=1 Tax=Siccibacter colletis TaxID=1505757 RepID=UPI00068A1F10|nr:glucosaminidase domain-containing protein [Siccibacter colletis]